MPVQDIVVAVEDRLRLDTSKIGAGLRFTPPLRPDVLATRHSRQEVVLLLLATEVEDGRREEADSVGADPPRDAGEPVLLLIDQPLDQVTVPTSTQLAMQ